MRRKPLALALSWALLCLANTCAGSGTHVCDAYEVLYPTIYEQLAPFMGGISQSQVDKASDHFQDEYYSTGPNRSHAKFNLTAARELAPNHTDYPWSNPFMVKVVSRDGTLYLPGGRIPSHRDGYAFSANGGSSYLLVDLINVTDKYGPFPDMEFFITSGDFQRVTDLSEDGTAFPTFGASSSKHYYDLVLPEHATTTKFKAPPDEVMDWSMRRNVVVGRYNAMCHRGGSSLHWRGHVEKKGCVRYEFHDIGKSELNHDGLLDIGIYQFVEEPKAYASPEYLSSAKFRLVLDGATTANRLPSLLQGGQLILLEDHSPMFSHFYEAFKPWVHYVPVGRDDYQDIFNVTSFLINNDDLARRIAQQSREFAIKYLQPEASECYTKKMLEVLSSLFAYKPRPLGQHAITLREAIELLEADKNWLRDHAES